MKFCTADDSNSKLQSLVWWMASMVVDNDGQLFRGYIGFDTMFSRLRTCV